MYNIFESGIGFKPFIAIFAPLKLIMKKLAALLLLLPLLTFYSCKDDIDLNADYEDITIVYCLLDPSTDTTFMKVNKAFLGEGNVLEMARIEDSSIYKTDLSATVEQYRNSDLINTYPFDPITVTDKEPGVFYNPNQMLYYSLMDINEDDIYRLNVRVKNKQVTAETSIINYFSISRPSAGAAFVRIRNDENIRSVEWSSARNGKRYEVYIRFNFRELFAGSADTTDRFIQWALGTKKSNTANGGDDLSVSFTGESFFNWIEQNLPYEQERESTVVARFTQDLEYIIDVADEDLNTFMEVNEPSSSVVQDKPEFTNIDNGLGIFSCRLRQTRIKKIHPETVTIIKNLEPDMKFEY